MDVSAWQEEDIATLLGHQFPNWSAWKDEALVIQASGVSQRAMATVRTAVKMSKKLPRLEIYSNLAEPSSMNKDGHPGEMEDKADVYPSGLKRVKNEPMLPVEEMFGSTIIQRINLLQDTLVSIGESTGNKVRALQVGLGIRLNKLELQVGTRSSSDAGCQLPL
jgi:hypothetical protein